MSSAKPIVVLVLAAVAAPALAESPLAGPSAHVIPAHVIDVTPPAAPATVVVLRGSSAPPQPWGGSPAAQALGAPQAPAATYGNQAYAPAYYFPPGYFQTPLRRAVRHALPPAPLVAPPYPIKPWGVGLAPFQR